MNQPPTKSAPPAGSTARTGPPATPARKERSTTPHCAHIFASLGRATPLMRVKLPPTHSDRPSVARARTAPFASARQPVSSAPVRSENAARLARGTRAPDGLTAAEKVPPTMTTSPATAVARTGPSTPQLASGADGSGAA
ncbi:hypothetical protein GHK92_03370 [Nocardioides sp. dk4132]|uniref:hypothetical protein n=1 Tax=unclassified Nocardioides TaxID=2615069 RepID=UPI0012979937|nr:MULTISPECIES: hypothetical protein [unclassified Nocardioides]MQW74902.1 hypothetical protein [Nocardioides sp. dk4132]QGA07907.1 hypothetical protein GFH29_11240 [Nocardioides sp. dk884]